MGCAIRKGLPGSAGTWVSHGAPIATGRGRFWKRGKEGLIVRGNGKEEARQRISVAIKRYSTGRCHQGIGDIKPVDRKAGKMKS